MSVVATEEITKALTALQSLLRGVNAVLLASSEGRVHGSTLPSGPERLHFSAISAATLAIAGKGTRDMQLGELTQVVIRARSGSIVLLGLGHKAVLSLVLGDNVAPEPVLEAAKGALSKLEALI